jgi:hypothetical protein
MDMNSSFVNPELNCFQPSGVPCKGDATSSVHIASQLLHFKVAGESRIEDQHSEGLVDRL